MLRIIHLATALILFPAVALASSLTGPQKQNSPIGNTEKPSPTGVSGGNNSGIAQQILQNMQNLQQQNQTSPKETGLGTLGGGLSGVETLGGDLKNPGDQKESEANGAGDNNQQQSAEDLQRQIRR